MKWKERKAFSASELPCPMQNLTQSWPTQQLGDASTICYYSSFCELTARVSVHILLSLEDEAFKTHLLTCVKFPIITPQNSIMQSEKSCCSPLLQPLRDPNQGKKLQNLNVKSILRTQGVWRRNTEGQHCLKKCV